LLWASQPQLKLGHVVSDYVRKKLKKKALGYAIGRTILGGLWASVAMPKMVMQFYDVIDNPWSVVMARTEQAAAALAVLLAGRVQVLSPYLHCPSCSSSPSSFVFLFVFWSFLAMCI